MILLQLQLLKERKYINKIFESTNNTEHNKKYQSGFSDSVLKFFSSPYQGKRLSAVLNFV
jgi:hypothetical protein